LHPTAGVRTTYGCAPLRDTVPAADSWTVGLLRQAGSVLVGKTNAPEFGPTCYTENDVTDRPAVTPYDLTRYASGSSGGAAAAVAAGLLPVGHASDGAGSIRTPAATCHLVGFKPSKGLVSPAPQSSFQAAGTEGPIARTVEDAALFLDVVAHPSPGDLYGWEPERPLVDALTQTPPSLKVGLWTDTGIDGVDPHPEAVRAVTRAAALLRELGHDVREVALPARCDEANTKALRSWFVSNVGGTVPTLIPADQHHLLRPYTQHLVAQAAAMTASELVLGQTTLARYASTFLAVFADLDVVLTPTTSGPPVKVGHFFSEGVEREADLMLAWSCYTPWVNLAGLPAVSLPSHLADGLPYAVHLVGRPRYDAQLLSLSAQLERAQLWDVVHPSSWES
jgi:amidase